MKLWKYVLFFSFAILLSVLCVTVCGAEIYHPDGTVTVDYTEDYATEDCDRMLRVTFVDEEGTFLKQVDRYVSRGEEKLAFFNLYHYDIIAFESDQGLWETCKLTWSSGGSAWSGGATIRYYFRTALSKEVLNIKITMRKFDPVTVITEHYIEHYDGVLTWSVADSTTEVLDYGDLYESAANHYDGYTLYEGYESSIREDFCLNIIGKYENCKSLNNLDWTPISKDLDAEYPDYNTYHTDVNGTMGYYTDRVLHIKYYYDVNQQTYTFDANGGSDAPETITEYFGNTITIPDTIPIKENATFLGWSEDADSDDVAYSPGDEVTIGTTRTLYAVWDDCKCDFSAIIMRVVPNDLYKYDTVTVHVRVDNWDTDDAYSDVPVTLLYNGEVIGEGFVDLAVYGYANIKWSLNVGGNVGEQEVEVRINWDHRNTESDPENNRDIWTISVSDYDHELSIDLIEPNAPYVAGESVISSFVVYNDSASSVLPEHGCIAVFTAYTEENGLPNVICEETKTVIVPANNVNLIWFSWEIPENAARKTVYYSVEINANEAVDEVDRDNNKALCQAEAVPQFISQTPNTNLQTSWQNAEDTPVESGEGITWSVWEYENGSFVKKQYGVTFAPRVNAQIIPHCQSSVLVDGQWVMRSGYGIRLQYAPLLIDKSGCEVSGVAACTVPDGGIAYFPEYGYSAQEGECRSLEWVGEEYVFEVNPNAADDERLHFISVGYRDGDYSVAVSAYVWTPAGRISVMALSNVIRINGSLYDDWYQG